MRDVPDPAERGAERSRRPAPQHVVLTEKLLALIGSGHYPVGELLPTELALSAEFKLSRQTVREALRRLAEQGLITRQPGVGTRVVRRTPHADNVYSITSMSELEGYAEEARLDIAEMSEAPVFGEQARLLECSEGALWLTVHGIRRRRADDVPLGVACIQLRSWFPGVTEHLKRLKGAIPTMLAREYDASIEEIHQEARAVLLTRQEAAALQMPAGGPGLAVVRRYYMDGPRLVLHGRIVYAADRFAYSLKFRKNDPARR